MSLAAGPLVALCLAALPQGAVRLRAELRGEPVGFATLEVRCAGGGAACRLRYASRLRLPAEAGGGVRARDVEVEVDGAGAYAGGDLRVAVDGAQVRAAGRPGAVPSAALELALAAGGGDGCRDFFDEEAGGDPPARRACARREGDRLVADAGGTWEVIAVGRDGFPDEVVVEGALRFVRDAAAALPARPPRLAGVRVPGPADPAEARAFCGVPRDRPASSPPSEAPPPRAAGASCREKAAAWLAQAARAGLAGRTAVGVAWDGEAFVWHAWAEVRARSGWAAVDPTFGQAPAEGPRFTVATFADGEVAARAAAGRRVLACWGAARVEGAEGADGAAPPR